MAVSVATVWARTVYPRQVDKPALGNPANPRGWIAAMTVAQKQWLVGKLETQARYGTKVIVIGHHGTGWTRIAVPSQPTPRDGRGYPGWVPTVQLTSTPPPTAGTTAVVRAPTAWLWSAWSSAGLAGRHVMEVSYGTSLPVASATPARVVVTLIGGRRVAIRRGSVVLHVAGASWGATGRKLVAEGRKFLGLQYLWAGTSGFGFDCSGFTNTLYAAFGIRLPRDADRQAVHGTPVSWSSLRAGDLVFFRSGPAGPIIHVGMYVGGGDMIDAPRTGAPVRIESVQAFGNYAGARRYLPSAPASGPRAAAEPTTPVAYPAQASATRYTGAAFDTCTAPPLTDMQAWLASPFRAIGVYVGGQNRTCLQAELTATWVRAVVDLGWRLIPIYKGLQAPCGGKPTDAKIVPAAAAAAGTSAADDASTQVKALGLFRGSAIYYDMEHYTTTDTGCRAAVLTFLSAWTRELHRLGYVSGVYENLNLGARDLAGVYASSAYARPDALWIARYDLDPALTGWAGISDSLWAVGQRAKQYHADFAATYGGVKLTIDADNLDAPVGTTAFAYQATALVRARTGPSPSYPLVRTFPAGASVSVVCQAPGSAVGTTRVWDKLNDGSYVTDAYISTPSATGYSAPVTRCRYPYQVTPANGVNERSGPSVTYPVTGVLPGGALAWLVCQQAGAAVGSTRIWDKIDYRHWVSDNWVATPSSTSYSKPVPRC